MPNLTFEDLQNLIYKYYFHDYRENILRIEILRNILKTLGINSTQDVIQCFELYNHHDISRRLNTNRNGSITEFTELVLIAVGRDIIQEHPYCINPIYDNKYWRNYYDNWFQKVEKVGIIPGKLRKELNK